MKQVVWLILGLIVLIGVVSLLSVFVLFLLKIQPTTSTEYARTYELRYFSGVKVNKEDSNLVDIYGTIKKIDSKRAIITLALTVPAGLIRTVESKFYIPIEEYPEIIKIRIDNNLRLNDPLDSRTPKGYQEIVSADKNILQTFTNAYVHIVATVDEHGKLLAREISTATITIQ